MEMKESWKPSKREIAKAIITSLITTVLIAILMYLFFTASFSPLTHKEIGIVTKYSVRDALHLRIKNQGNLPIESITVRVFSEEMSYKKERDITTRLDIGESIPLEFDDLKELVKQSTEFLAKNYTLKNVSEAEKLCESLEENHTITLSPDNSIISSYKALLKRKILVPVIYHIEIDYDNKKEEDDFKYYPDDYKEEIIYPELYLTEPNSVEVKLEGGECKFDSFSLSALKEKGTRTAHTRSVSAVIVL